MSRLTDYRNSRPPSRPDSANLVDLHVYIVPPDIWRDRFNNLLNQSVSETVSIGIIRVSPDIKLTEIRNELPKQLEDLVPIDFIFLRSVGRSLTRLKPKQENHLKAKHFLPPVAYAPELYLLEATADIRASLTSDGSSRSQSYNHLAGDDSQRGFHSFRDGPGGYGGPGAPYDDRYTQTKINEQPNEEHGGKRQNRGNKSYRDPVSHYSPLPRIESRTGSPLGASGEHTRDTYKNTPRQPYSRQSKVADDKYSRRHGRHDNENPNQDDEHTQPLQEYDNQSQNKHSNRHRHGDQPQSDDDRQAYEKGGNTQYYKTPRTDRQTDDDDYFSYSKTPPHSPGRPVPYSHTKGQGQGHPDPHSSPNTNHTNEDSGFAGLSPDERERDNYLDDYERRKRELQQRLDKEKGRQNQLNRHNEELARLAEMDEAERLAEEKRREEEYDRRRFESEEQRKRDEEEERRLAEERRREEARRKDDRKYDDEERRREEDERREEQRLENEREREKRRLEDEEKWRLEDEERDRLKKTDAEQRKKENELRAKRRKDEEEARKKREEERKGRGNASNRRKNNDDEDKQKRNRGKGPNSDDEKRRRADEDKKKNGGKSHADDKSGRNRSRYSDNDDRLTNGNETDHSKWDDEDADSRKNRDSENDDNDSRRYRDNDNNRDRRRQSGSADDADGFPTPPPLEMKSPREGRDTDSAYGRRRDEKERLLAELDEAKDARKSAEQDREELVKRAKQLQHKTTNRRNNARPLHEDREARDVWKKRYFEEKKRTAPLEDSTNRLRHELEVIHRKLMTTLEGPKDGKPVKYVDGKPSPKNNCIIQCTRLQHEIEDLRRRSENAKMKLTAEMKLRSQADAELRALRAELTQKKINLTLSRNKQLVALSPGAEMMDGREEIAA